MDRDLGEAARKAMTTLARRLRRTDRVIKDLPDWAGFGNQLFFYLWADTQQHRGINFRLVLNERSTPWFEHFPLLAHLTIARGEVRIWDNRDTTSWHDITSIDRPGTPTREDVERFIRTYLMPSGVYGRSAELARGLTLNVRRGDYFSDPEVRGRFSFDQIAYIEVVLGKLRADGREPKEIRVVSDDLAWCRSRLHHLETETTSLRFLASGDPVEDLAVVAGSRELIIMNSSFSIWAAYISNHLYGDNHHQVHVPAFGTRPFDGTLWPSIDPRWNVVSTIPGGWDS